MKFLDLFRRGSRAEAGQGPRNEAVITLDLKDPRVAEFLRSGFTSTSGETITDHSALKVAVAYRCCDILSGAVATLPLDLKRRVSDKVRQDASDHALWPILKTKPNSWQTPSQFKRLMQMFVLLRGNGYALKVRALGKIIALVPLTGHMHVEQVKGDLIYTYTPHNGERRPIPQADIFHLAGLSLDGITGLSILSYARESLGLSLTTERHANTLFKKGTASGGVFTHPKSLSNQVFDKLKASLEEFRGAKGESSYHDIILEEAMTYTKLGMSSVDAQFVETREFTAYEICAFFGVPPHMVGLTTKTTSWGSGIEQQSLGFVAYTLQPHLTMWGETIARDLLTAPGDENVYALINPSGLVRGDIKTRFWAYATGRQWGWLSANDIREKEDENPIPEGGDIYLQPSNMQQAGKPPPDDPPPADPSQTEPA
jgi:HK97 family phage portal protein